MNIAELRQLPRREKLQIVESLWSDLAHEESLIQSPSWHGKELRKTEEDLKLGKVEATDWEEAKKSSGNNLNEPAGSNFCHRGSFSRAKFL